jgi:hypothetical protein
VFQDSQNYDDCKRDKTYYAFERQLNRMELDKVGKIIKMGEQLFNNNTQPENTQLTKYIDLFLQIEERIEVRSTITGILRDNKDMKSMVGFSIIESKYEL